MPAQRRRVAVVVGGSTGIGAAVVERLAADDTAVVFCGYDDASVQATASRLGGQVLGRRCDVRSSADMERLVAAAVDAYGRLDVLVNSAGIQTYGTIDDTTDEDWDRVLDVNLTGMFRSIKAAVPQLRAAGGGSIVNVSSVQAFVPQQNVLGYSVSKAGVNGLTRSLAVDLAVDRIRVNTVCPGSVDTPMLRASAQRFGGQAGADRTLRGWGSTHPLGRVATPAEVAEVVAFLAGEASSFVTGSEYRVDGGLLTVLPAVLQPSGR